MVDFNSKLEQPKVAIYARYSSDKQNETSISVQIKMAQKYAKDNGFPEALEENIYIERAKSAKYTDNRPEFSRMYKDAMNGKFSTIIVYKCDRIFRNTGDSGTYRRKFRQCGIEILSATESNDFLSIGINDVLSQHYVNVLSERVQAGSKEAALECRFLGGVPPYGYTVKSKPNGKSNEKFYEIVESEAENVRMIFEMYANNCGYGKIIDALEAKGARTKSGRPFGKNSLHDLLKNPKYIGVYEYNKRENKDNLPNNKKSNRAFKDESEIIKIEDAIPAIISKGLFAQVAVKMAKNAKGVRVKAQDKEKYLLSGRIKCGCCGCTLVGSRKFTKTNKYVYYRCNNRDRTRKCSCKELHRDNIESFVFDIISDRILSPENRKRLIKEFQKMQLKFENEYAETKKKLNQELLKMSKQKENIMSVIKNTGECDDIFLEELKNITKQLKSVENQLLEIESIKPEPVNEKEFDKLIEKTYNILNARESTQLRFLVESYVDEVIVDEDDVTVVLTLENIRAKVGGGPPAPAA